MRWMTLILLLAGCDLVLLEKNALVPADAPPETCLRNGFADDVEMLGMFDRYEPDGTSMTVNGELVETPQTPTGYVSIATNGPPLDFSSATAHVRIVRRLEPPNTESFFGLHLDDNHYYYYSIDDGLGMGRKENGDDPLDVKQLTFDTQSHVWIRFRHDRQPDEIVFETSANGVKWTERHRIDVKFDLRMVRLRIGAGAYPGDPPVGHPIRTSGVFDDFELCR